MTRPPKAKISIAGSVTAKSSHGTVEIQAGQDFIELYFSDENALKAVAVKPLMKHFAKYRGASSFLEGEIRIHVSGALWLVVRNGKLSLKRPFAAGFFFVRQWLFG